MDSQDTENPDEKQPKVFTDEDWKNRVRAENEALDRTLKDEGAASTADASAASSKPKSRPSERPKIDADRLPPADFAALVTTFSTQAMVALGLLADPGSGETERELGLARYFIDLLGVIESKTAGNLEPNEHAMLETMLHQLRMAYVEVSKQAGKKSDDST